MKFEYFLVLYISRFCRFFSVLLIPPNLSVSSVFSVFWFLSVLSNLSNLLGFSVRSHFSDSFGIFDSSGFFPIPSILSVFSVFSVFSIPSVLLDSLISCDLFGFSHLACILFFSRFFLLARLSYMFVFLCLCLGLSDLAERELFIM